MPRQPFLESVQRSGLPVEFLLLTHHSMHRPQHIHFVDPGGDMLSHWIGLLAYRARVLRSEYAERDLDAL